MKKEIMIDDKHMIGKMNPGMWGLFFEEINHAGDGGLYAELIRNRNFADIKIPEGFIYADGKVISKNGFELSFDRTDLLPGWYLKKSSSAIACMDLTEEKPRNSKCAEQLRLSVVNAAKGVRICNEGYWGIPLKKQIYYGFCIVRGEGISAVKVGLMYPNGVAVCSQSLQVGKSFEKLFFQMHCPAENKTAHFFIEVEEAGILYVDFVTLFPEDTYNERPYGFRRDLVEMLKALHPGFLRFPGGCVVEGMTLDNAIHWERTRGPAEDRPGHYSLWNYRTTDGLGILEMCQLAEDLDTEIMYVVNCGMACQSRKGEVAKEETLEYWLKNAENAIEYIIGDVSTEYGALRAADGHPAPFNLKYVEIGNENYGEDYAYRYKKFYEVLKVKYPALTFIANERVAGAKLEMVDDHYYPRPQQFPSDHDIFRQYEKETIPVYIGEFACWSGGSQNKDEIGKGNVLSAISEAVFMIRLENLCNTVRMASYAPLFAREEGKAWDVNLINFDGRHVYGIPAYEVMRLFCEYTVDRVYQTNGMIEESAATNLYVTAGEKNDRCIIKMANFGPESTEVVLRMPEHRLIKEEALLLASGNEKDTNSLLYPDYVAATPISMESDGEGLGMEMPPYSLAVIVCKAQ